MTLCLAPKHFRNLGAAIDIRHDVPRYRVYRDGELSDEPLDIEHFWQDDLVAFAIGCSFSFEQPLLDAGIAFRHIDPGYRPTSTRALPLAWVASWW